MKSQIFKPGELKEIERQRSGDYSDKFGLFSRKVKPKINEVITMIENINDWKELIKIKKQGRKPIN